MIRTLAAALVASTALTALPAPAVEAAPAAADEPVRVLIVGDSVTQGSAGDWTWRYRLWQSLRAQGVDVDLVGPRTDLFDNVAAAHGSQAYADPAFDRDHSARWGAAFGFEDVPVKQLVATYRPDVVVEVLGVNNLTFFRESPEAVVADLERFVASARSVDPDIDVVAATLPQTWKTGALGYNERLPAAAAGLTTPASPVVVAHPEVGFTRDGHTWDGAHANARGEVAIAAAVADALAVLDVGDGYAGPTDVPLGPRTPARAAVEVAGTTAHLTWTSAPGTTSERVWQREPTRSRTWRLVRETDTGSWTSSLEPGVRTELRLQPVKGWTASDVRSAVVSALAPAPPPDVVTGLDVQPRPRSLTARWDAAPGATSYVVRWAPRGHPDTARARSTSARTARLLDLRAGQTYRVQVRGVGPGGPGPWSDAVTGRPTR